jgi:hypothetical protein
VTQPDESYTVREVPSDDETPTPNHHASEDMPFPPPEINGKKRKRSLFGPPPGDAGTRDFRPPKAPKPTPRIPNGGFAPGIEKMYGAIALAAMAFDAELAIKIMEVAPEAAKAWDELARRNITVRRILVSMMETTAWGAVFAAHLPLFLLMAKRVAGSDPRFSAIGEVMAQNLNPEPPPEETL